MVTHDAVIAALLAVPPRQRAAIVLRYYQDLTEAQTAEAMGCAVGTVKSQVAAGLTKLRGLMGQSLDELEATS
jgi:RNA polymerase sigma factor (sigma-70 family)